MVGGISGAAAKGISAQGPPPPTCNLSPTATRERELLTLPGRKHDCADWRDQPLSSLLLLDSSVWTHCSTLPSLSKFIPALINNKYHITSLRGPIRSLSVVFEHIT